MIFIPKYGYLGAAGFTIVAEALIFLFNFIITTKTIKYFPKLKIFIKVIAASLVMSLFLYLLQGQNVILLIIFASFIYLLALYIFKGFSKEFILEIIKIKKQTAQK